MDSSGNQVWNYLLTVLQASAIQLLILLGPLILLSTIMHFIAQKNEKISRQLFGRNAYLFLFGWLGVSVHELGHAFFAVIFGHRIIKIRLFAPNKEEGTLGYVDHSYNPNNFYHQIGNFFIGIGPILFGSFLLFLISLLLFGVNILSKNPFESDVMSFSSLASFQTTTNVIVEGLINYLQSIWYADQSTWWKLLILGYALYSIGSSIKLSKSDIASAWKGFLLIVFLLLIFNLSTFWIANFTENLIFKIAGFISAFCFLILLSILMNMIFMGTIALLNAIRNLLIKHT